MNKGRLIKWDAAIGDSPPTDIDPTTHPLCAEVVEFKDGQSPVVIYRRDDNATDDSGRTVHR